MDFHDRHGFVRLALETGAPLVPVVAIGGQETALFLSRGASLARALRLHRMLRLDVLPVSVGVPLGPRRRRRLRTRAAPREDHDRGAGPDRRPGAASATTSTRPTTRSSRSSCRVRSTGSRPSAAGRCSAERATQRLQFVPADLGEHEGQRDDGRPGPIAEPRHRSACSRAWRCSSSAACSGPAPGPRRASASSRPASSSLKRSG